ncbi:MAG TPA: type I glyceraldehyde-3-phosphate dehydrogenase [Patescibacteria group bacterium]|nr:type I glyceraldehyde-3-phosphate dehydrogenase [Patescibacteria group bacterium]
MSAGGGSASGGKKIRVGINGFGRIGKTAFKIAFDSKRVDVVGINDLSGARVSAETLRFDSNYGAYKHNVGFTEKEIVVAGKKIPVFKETEPNRLPWGKLKVDVVLECTGRFTDSEKAAAHLKAGAKRVVISAPAKDEGVTPTFLLGVNTGSYKGEKIVSNASCTTNCIAPVAQVLNDAFGIEKMMMTTVHSVTAEQNLVDGNPPGLKGGDLRRARSAIGNIVPTSTGAAISTAKAIPALEGKFDSISLRVPTRVGSLSDFTILLKKDVTIEQVNKAFVSAEKTRQYRGILQTTTDPLVSSDIIGNPHSAIVDLSLTNVVGGNMVKVIAWYDNEWGYSNRLVEIALEISSRST